MSSQQFFSLVIILDSCYLVIHNFTCSYMSALIVYGAHLCHNSYVIYVSIPFSPNMLNNLLHEYTQQVLKDGH